MKTKSIKAHLRVGLSVLVMAEIFILGPAWLATPEKRKLCLLAGVIVSDPVADREFMGRNYQPGCGNEFDYNGQTYRITNSNGDYKRVDK